MRARVTGMATWRPMTLSVTVRELPRQVTVYSSSDSGMSILLERRGGELPGEPEGAEPEEHERPAPPWVVADDEGDAGAGVDAGEGGADGIGPGVHHAS